MAVAAVLVAVGLVAPLLLGGRAGGSPRLIIAANIAALAVAWVGLFALVANVLGAHDDVAVGNLAELCQLFMLWSRDQSTAATAVVAVVLTLLPGRALSHLGRACADQVRLRRTLRLGLPGPSVTHAHIDTVACTVGVFVPRVIVDAEWFDRLPTVHQRTVLAHERQHARARHLLIDIVVRCLAAGLAPWPAARIAAEQVRRQLEAAADDAAAAQVGRRAVATAIVDIACEPAPRVGALGATGWAAWRVDRLLSTPRCSPSVTLVSFGAIAIAVLVTVHMVAHSMHSLVDLPASVWSAVCCVV